MIWLLDLLSVLPLTNRLFSEEWKCRRQFEKLAKHDKKILELYGMDPDSKKARGEFK